MKRVAALLATALAATTLVACGGGAEPGAPKRATLVLDFQPNAVHAGIYAALQQGYYRDAGVDVDVQQPSSSSDAPKLLEAGKAQFAILDIHDLAIARERGFDLVAVVPIVQRPLASVIAGDPDVVRRPRDLEGRTVGVTGLPSDDAVLDSVVSADGGDPAKVHRVTIGFNAVAALAAGRVDAATAFWNARSEELERMGAPIREFRVDDFGAPRYPELVVATTPNRCSASAGLVRGLQSGYAALGRDPARALRDLVSQVSGLDQDSQRAQLDALTSAQAFSAAAGGRPSPVLPTRAMKGWLDWAATHGLVDPGARGRVA